MIFKIVIVIVKTVQFSKLFKCPCDLRLKHDTRYDVRRADNKWQWLTKGQIEGFEGSTELRHQSPYLRWIDIHTTSPKQPYLWDLIIECSEAAKKPIWEEPTCTAKPPCT